MRIVDLLLDGLQKLKDDYTIDVLSNKNKATIPFALWALGKVVLDSDATSQAREGIVPEAGGDGVLASTVYSAFAQTDEKDLIPALTYDGNRRPVFVLVPQP